MSACLYVCFAACMSACCTRHQLAGMVQFLRLHAEQEGLAVILTQVRFGSDAAAECLGAHWMPVACQTTYFGCSIVMHLLFTCALSSPAGPPPPLPMLSW